MAKCKTCGKNCVREYCFNCKPRKPMNQNKQEFVSRKPIKKVSDKRKRQEVLYSILRRTFMEHNPNCEICGKPSTDIHHKNGRENERLNDTEYWMSVCRNCHQYEIHENPINAKIQGWLL